LWHKTQVVSDVLSAIQQAARAAYYYTVENPVQLDSPQAFEEMLDRAVIPSLLDSIANWAAGKP